MWDDASQGSRGIRRYFSLSTLLVPALAITGVILLGAGPERKTPPESTSLAGILARSEPERVLVLGDSVAATLGESLSRLGPREGFSVFVRATGDCSLFEGVRPTHNAGGQTHSGGNCASRWSSDVAEVDPHVTLIVLGGGFLAPVLLHGSWRFSCDEGFSEAYAGELIRRIEEIRPRAGRLVFARVPYPMGGWKNSTLDRRTDCFNTVVEDVARRVPQASVLDLARRLCPTKECAFDRGGGAPSRPDGLHFQGPGAEAVARWVFLNL